MARIQIDQADLRRVIRGASLRELENTGRRVVNRGKILCPVDTGRLRASIKGKANRTWTLRPQFTVSSNVDYAEMVHDGTRPHIIRPRTKQALKFTVGGQVVFAKVVHHPGTRARPFLDRALREETAGRGYRITN
ncbi:MAG TPA: hypothetical protein VFX97_20615 [Pyrinomonadaceae bacterium]|nr:hypothetical protein [Pyrinomonadaceae bacterium]